MTTSSDDEKRAAIERPPFPKKKVAILCGYSGIGFHGMQVNPGRRTIESELFQALLDCGLILPSNAFAPQKVDWMRACRTDKGVHAAGQVVSLKMILKGLPKADNQNTQAEATWDSEKVVSEINGHLPKEIRVYGIKKMMAGFDSWQCCDSRFYEYLLPSYMLEPVADLSEFLEAIRSEQRLEKSEQAESQSDSEIKEIKVDRDFRATEKQVQALNAALDLFKGTHLFHNFTIGKPSTDKSVQRFIRSFEITRKFIQDGTEWLALRVHGQSFMLHQIRKMVGLAVLATKFNIPQDRTIKLFDECFSRNLKVNIPKVPGEGLFLERAVFSGYNKKASEQKSELMEFEEEKLETTKEELIYPAIYAAEKTGVFSRWLSGIRAHAYELKFLLPHIIP